MSWRDALIDAGIAYLIGILASAAPAPLARVGATPSWRCQQAQPSQARASYGWVVPLSVAASGFFSTSC